MGERVDTSNCLTLPGMAGGVTYLVFFRVLRHMVSYGLFGCQAVIRFEDCTHRGRTGVPTIPCWDKLGKMAEPKTKKKHAGMFIKKD